MSNEKLLIKTLKNNNYIEEYFFLDYFLSLIIGLVIGLIIGYMLFKKYIYHGPNSKDIIKKIYYDDNNKSYKLEPIITICPSEYSMHKIKK